MTTARTTGPTAATAPSIRRGTSGTSATECATRTRTASNGPRAPRRPAPLPLAAGDRSPAGARLRRERSLEVARVGVAVAGRQRRAGLAASHEDLLHRDEA